MQEYTVIIGGLEHTLLLDEADAKRLGGVVVKAAPAPQNKARTVAPNKGKP